MTSQDTLVLCQFISPNEDTETKAGGTTEQLPDSLRKCCPACAWKQEQMIMAEQKQNASNTDRVLQGVADRMFTHSSPDEGLVKEVTSPLTERQIRYGSILSHAIQCKTVSYDEPERNKNKYPELLKLHRFLKQSFPIVYEQYPPEVINEYSLLFRIQGENDDLPIMLCAHLDVVPASEDTQENTWEQDPFGGKIVNGIVWGRGAIDNKHNVVAQLGAVEELLAAGQRPKRTTYISMGHDEEIFGDQGADKIAKVLAEENIKFEFILDEGTMCVQGALPGYDHPVALVGCAEKGFMNVELTVTGKGGHSSAPPIDAENENPIKIMSKAINALESNPLPAHFQKNSIFRNTLEYVANHMKKPLNVIFRNFWLFGPLFKKILLKASNGAAASIRTTTAVTKVHGGMKFNAMPTEVKAFVNHRIHPNDSIEKVLEHDRKVINDERVRIKLMDGSIGPSPISNHKTGKGFKAIKASVKTVFGFISTPACCIGNTDTRCYWDFSKNIYRFSPIPLTMKETTMFHGYNERIGVDALEKMVDFYKALLRSDEY